MNPPFFPVSRKPCINLYYSNQYNTNHNPYMDQNPYYNTSPYEGYSFQNKFNAKPIPFSPIMHSSPLAFQKPLVNQINSQAMLNFPNQFPNQQDSTFFKQSLYLPPNQSPVHKNLNQLTRGPVISFHDISYTIQVRNKWGFFIRSDKLLHEISGVFKPGMNAIMGPTGCGKTTLLDILANRKDKNGTAGTVLIDAVKLSHNTKAPAGYVVQDDLIMGTLSVRENLMFSANMRLPSKVSWKEKKERVEKIIRQLGLSKCANTKVGTEFMRGVSGGERKRTCIGMELVVSPTILFLDEPTTGLDAFTANSVMKLLHRLSKKGLTVVFSIHQPRYSIFKLFDTFLLLAAGKVVYQGPASQALSHFSLHDFQCEEHDNPPDFFLDVINGDLKNSPISPLTPSLSCHNLYYQGENDVMWEEDSGMCDSSNGSNASKDGRRKRSDDRDVETGNIEERIDEEIKSIKEGEAKKLIVEFLVENYEKSHHYESIQLELDAIMVKQRKKLKQKSSQRPTKQQYATSLGTQLYHVSRRTIKNVIRNPSAAIAQSLIMLVFGLIVGGLFYKITDDVRKAMQDRAGAFFFIILIQMFGNLSAIELFIKERKLFLHESKSGFYRVSVYFLSKVFFDLIPLRLFPLCFFCVITYFLMGLATAADKFFIFFLTLFFTTLVAAALTFVISAFVNILAIANILVGLTYIIMTLFAGLLLNVSSIPKWLNWLQYLSIVRYSFKTLLINELSDATFYVYANNTIVASDTTTSLQFLDSQEISSSTPWDLWQNIVALAGASVALLLCCYFQLLRLASKR